jgi:hypothetical protein
MAKKFRLIRGSTGTDADGTPSSLGPHGRALWARVMAEYDISDCGGRELLAQAGAAADRAENCRAIIDKDGEMIRGSGGGWRDHPLIRMELSARSLVIRTLMRLGVTSEPIKQIGRPANIIGWDGEEGA